MSCGHFEGLTNFLQLAVHEKRKNIQFRHYQAPKTKNSIFRALPVALRVNISLTTHSKSCLAVIFTSQRALCDWRFTRYRKSCNFDIISPPPSPSPPPKKIKNLGHFQLSERSERYTYLRTPIVNHVLRSFVGANQRFRTEIHEKRTLSNFGTFWSNWPKKLVLPTFQPVSLITKSILKIDSECFGVCKN